MILPSYIQRDQSDAIATHQDLSHTSTKKVTGSTNVSMSEKVSLRKRKMKTTRGSQLDVRISNNLERDSTGMNSDFENGRQSKEWLVSATHDGIGIGLLPKEKGGVPGEVSGKNNNNIAIQNKYYVK